MSKAKFAAAKELIQEHKYDEARAILRSIDHPTAHKWLAQLNRLNPPLPDASNLPPPPLWSARQTPPISIEQNQYYYRENRRAIRQAIGSGIKLIVIGLLTFGAFAFFAIPYQNIETGVTKSNPGLAWLLVPLGFLSIIVGVYRIRRGGDY